MGKLIDLTGQRFGRLTVLERAWSRKGQLFWRCKCDCGRICDVQGSSLRNGRTKSCGCLHDELAHVRLAVRNYFKPDKTRRNKPLYRVWSNMRQRCNNPNNPEYHLYGERGITICAEWDNDYETFETWALENGYQIGLSIDRIDNDAEYSPTNCRWTDAKTQSNNQRKTILLTYNGKTQPLSYWADEFGISRNVLKCRIRAGWPVERALTEPIHTEKINKQRLRQSPVT